MQPPQRIIDLKLPVTWLIGCAAAIAMLMISLTWQGSAQVSKLENKIDQLLTANAKLEKRLDDRDARLESMRDSIIAIQRVGDTNSLRITALESARK